MRTLIKDVIAKDGQGVMLKGWVRARRDHGKLVFIDLWDRTGIVQVIFGPGVSAASDLRLEYVVEVSGMVKKRPPAMVNDKVETGAYEVEAKTLEIISTAEALPIPVDTDFFKECFYKSNWQEKFIG